MTNEKTLEIHLKDYADEIYKAIETYRWLVKGESILTDAETLYDLILTTVRNYK